MITGRRPARILSYSGIVAAVLGLGKLHASAIAEPGYDLTDSARFGWSLVYVLVLGVVAYGLGQPDLSRSAPQALRTALAAAGGGAVAFSVVQLVVGDPLLPRFVVFGTAIVLVPWYVLCAGLADAGSSGEAHRDRVLVVSDTVGTAALRHELAVGAERPARVVAVVGVADAAPTGVGDPPLLAMAERERISVLVLDREAQAVPPIVAQAARLHRSGVRVRTLSLFYEEWLGKLPMSELEQASLLFDISELHRAPYVRLKRLVDVALATVGLLGLAGVAPVVLLGNRLGNRGPLLFRQDRVGKDGRVFPILKFRTMVPLEATVDAGAEAGAGDAAADGSGAWTTESDPRITPFGRLLRRSHLDELPQVLNILRGELSVVGPRPEQPRYVDELVQKLPFYDLRHVVRPGLTGWAQVKYGYAADEADALEKLQYEFWYLRHQGPLLDARIVGRTVRSVLGREGR